MEDKLCQPCEEPIIDKLPACPLQCNSQKCKAFKGRGPLNVGNKPIIWVLGGPGVGKGTQCKMINTKYGFTHLSTGDLLRAEIKSGSERAKMLSDIMGKGELVPNEIVFDLLKQAMAEHVEETKGFLIDGYPREKYQGKAFEKNIAPVTLIIYFEASSATLKKRLQDDQARTHRKDDNEEAIKQRIKTFLENNDLIIAQYLSKVKRINAEQTVDQIFSEVQTILDPIVTQTGSTAT